MDTDTDTDLARSVRPPAAEPWWRFAMVWLVLAGPALVVVAGLVTAWIAFVHADVELHEPVSAVVSTQRPGAAGLR